MKKVLMAAAAVACFGTVAMAGPNAGGTLIVVSDGAIYTSDNAPYCGQSQATDCESANGETTGADSIVLHVLAAFAPAASPRLAGITFGIAYNEAEVFISDLGTCGNFELATDTWPASGSGTAVTWDAAQTGSLIDVYWIAAYNYYGNANTLDLTPHPSQGAQFADDSIPSEIDPIAALGSFGFDGPGNVPCPDAGSVPGACCADDGSCTVVPEADCAGEYLGDGTNCEPNNCRQPATGACCASDLSCSIRTEAECNEAGGIYVGDDVSCEPTPCVIPVVESTWGEIKSNFR